MSLPTNLTTNEVKDESGTENEFSRLRNDSGSVEFTQTGAAPNLPHRLKVSHSEVGAGVSRRRRSMVRVDFSLQGVTSLQPKTISAYIVVDIPVGDVEDYAGAKKAVANLLSFCASTGASTTILYDGTGYGAAALINGTL